MTYLNKIFNKNLKRVYLIGIGGIGISALAKFFLEKGIRVSGSDRDKTSLQLKSLKKIGAKIYFDHRRENLEKEGLPDLVIYTTAISLDNPEIERAKELKIKTLSYPEALKELSKDKYTIAISGTHGKTTTTSLISLILEKGGFDPTCVIGSRVKEFSGNIRIGKSKFLVIEACEYRKAFLNYQPKIIVLTNIDNDHLDYYKNIQEIIKSFSQYIQKLSKKDLLIANLDDQNILKVLKKARCRIIGYKIDKNLKSCLADSRIQFRTSARQIQKENFKKIFQAKNIKLEKEKTSFTVEMDDHKITDCKLELPGLHNVYNALASFALAESLRIDLKVIREVFSTFRGASRRFEIKKKKGIIFIDDYAHHPREIEATFSAIKQRFPEKKIWLVFQPHLYTRTKLLFSDFVRVLKKIKNLIILDIYAARERDTQEISSKDLVRAIKRQTKNSNVQNISQFSRVVDYLSKKARKGDLVVTIGAGNVWKIGEEI